MSKSEFNRLLKNFEGSNEDKARTLRGYVESDIDHSSQERNELLCFKTAQNYTFLLPPADIWPIEIQEKMESFIIDTDVQMVLERTGAISGFPGGYVLPMKTTTDGNCLLHAVSLFIWGIEDTNNFLRQVLYWNMCSNRFQERWLLHRKEEDQMLRKHFPHLCLTDETAEWQRIKQAANNNINKINGLHFFLEGIHIFVLANFLRRPIIVYSDSTVQNVNAKDNNVRGIYLPLMCHPDVRSKCPIIIGYQSDHFVPLLLSEIQTRNHINPLYKAPLTSTDGTPLPIRFLTKSEEENKMSVLVNNIHFSVDTATFTVQKLPVEYNLIVDYTELAGEIIRQTTENSENTRQFRSMPQWPLSFSTQQLVSIPSRSIRGVQQIQPKPCSTPDCDMYGLPERNGFCSKCFRSNEILHPSSNTSNIVAPMSIETKFPSNNLRSSEDNNEFLDLSVMGETCHYCRRFRCSEKTYPLCHECNSSKALIGQIGSKSSLVPGATVCGADLRTEITCSGQNGPLAGTSKITRQNRDERHQSNDKKHLRLNTENKICSTAGCIKLVHSPDLEKCSQCFLMHSNNYLERYSPNEITANTIQESTRDQLQEHSDNQMIKQIGGLIVQTETLHFKCKTENCLNAVRASLNHFCDPCKWYKREYGDSKPNSHRSMPSCEPPKHNQSCKCVSYGCEGFRYKNNAKCWPCLEKENSISEANSFNKTIGRYSPVQRSISPLDEKNLDLSTGSEKGTALHRCAWEKCQNLVDSPNKLCNACMGTLEESRGNPSSRYQFSTSVGFREGTKCQTLGCPKYGDPAQCNLCSKCYHAKSVMSYSQNDTRVTLMERNGTTDAENHISYKPPTYQLFATSSNPTQNDIVRSLSEPRNNPFVYSYLNTEPELTKAAQPANTLESPELFSTGTVGRMPYYNKNIENPPHFPPNTPTFNVVQSGTTVSEKSDQNIGSNIQAKNITDNLKLLEKEKKGRKCKSTSCTNYGDPKCFGYCNNCYATVAEHHARLANAAQRKY